MYLNITNIIILEVLTLTLAHTAIPPTHIISLFLCTVYKKKHIKNIYHVSAMYGNIISFFTI